MLAIISHMPPERKKGHRQMFCSENYDMEVGGRKNERLYRSRHPLALHGLPDIGQ